MNRRKIKSIIVIKNRYIGDSVLATPLLRALKNGFPQSRIYFLTDAQSLSLMNTQPFLDECLAFPEAPNRKNLASYFRLTRGIRNRHVDMTIDLTKSDRSALFTWLSGARYRIGYKATTLLQKLSYNIQIPYHFGSIHTVDHHLRIAEYLDLPVDDKNPFLTVCVQDSHWVDALLRTKGLDQRTPFAVIHPGARRWYKSWPAERFARLADLIQHRSNVSVVLSGGPSDVDVCHQISKSATRPVIDLSGQIPLAKLPALIRQSILLIGNDSAPIHIATAVKTPVIALFGPTRWEDWHPRRSQDTTIAVEFPCRPCGHSKPSCPLGNDYCMGQISLQTVWDRVRDKI